MDMLTDMLDKLDKHFNTSELQELCFELGIDYENLEGIGKRSKAMELLRYVQRYDRLAELAQVCQLKRPRASFSLQPVPVMSSRDAVLADGDSKKLLVFLSHASEDKPRVRKLCKRLRDDGFDPWLDEERLVPGQDWNLEIQQALRESQAILLCFSKLSVAKEGYIQREYKKAMDLQEEKPAGTIYVIPLRLDDCQVPFSIRELQYVDYPDGYERLVKALNIRAEKVNAAKAEPKPEKKTNPAPRVRKPEQIFSGPVYNIGAIHVGRDLIQGDQANYITNTTNIQSPSEFMQALEQVQAQLAELKKGQLTGAQARNLEVVEARLAEAAAEAQKPRPLGERVKTTLSEAKETLELLSGSLGAAANLGATLGGLVMTAVKVFGG